MADLKQFSLFVTIVLCTILCCVLCEEKRNCDIADKAGLPNDVCTYDVRMKGAHPKKNDQYFCAGYNVAKEVLGDATNPFAEGYIVKYEALADANTAHHILVFGCEKLLPNSDSIWNCGQVCEKGEQIVFAWAKNAPPLTLPNGVGQHIGGHTTKIKHIVIQIHYVNPLPAPDYSGIRMYITRQRQPFISGIYLLLSYGVTIPANTPKFHVDSSCVFNWGDSIIPFGYRTHAHSLGTVISGYKVDRGGVSKLVGKGNPQWPQAFYPVKDQFKIRPGDLLAARCTYNSTGRFRGTDIGSTSNDEMCNFYIMYYMNSSMEYRRGEDTCYHNQASQVFQFLPPDNDEPLPSNPALEEMAHSHHHGMGGGTNSNEGTTVSHFIDEPTVDVEKPLVDVSENKNGMNLKPELGMQFISAVKNIEIGQVGGLAVSPNGDLYIFHRGSNIWDARSFNHYNEYVNQNKPVTQDTVIILNKDGEVIRHFGKNSYFLPHGMSLDSEDNMWLTDVALHQVFRIPKGGTIPDMTLGTRFEPGTDKFHLCKPSDVAVMTTGEFFVSDGYCNSRIMKFDKNGYFIKQWGTASMEQKGVNFPPPGTFNLPHSVTVAEDKRLVCVADRENGRIQCFDLDGNFVRQMHPKLFGSSLYALEYCPNHGGILFAVNGPVFGKDPVDTQGFTMDINNGDILSIWNIPGSTLTHPHDITVDSTDHLVYVGELNPRKVWKFQMPQAIFSTANMSTVDKQPTGENKKPTPPTGVTKDVSVKTSMINVVKVTSTVPPSSNNVVNAMYTSSETSTQFTAVDFVTAVQTATVVNTVHTTSDSHKPMTANVAHSTAKKMPISVVNPVQSTSGTTEPPTVVNPVQSTAGTTKSPTVVNHVHSTAGTTKPPTVVNHVHSTAGTSGPPAVVNSAQSNAGNMEPPAVFNHVQPVIEGKKPSIVDLSNADPSNIEIGGNFELHMEKIKVEEPDGMNPSVIIGTMLVVPVLLLIIITVTVRMYRNGHFRNCGRRSSKKSVFSLGNFLHSHRGFDRLSTEDDDHDFDNVLDDSDNEEFNITRKA